MRFINDSFGRKLKQGTLLSLLSLSLLSTQARPAHAEGGGYIADMWTAAYSLITYLQVVETFNSVVEAAQAAAEAAGIASSQSELQRATSLGAMKAQTELEIAQKYASIDVMVNENTNLATIGAVIKETPPTGNSLCLRTAGFQGPEAMDKYVDDLTTALVKGFMDADRGADADGMGVIRSAGNWKIMCGMKFGNKVDKVPDDCKDDRDAGKFFQGAGTLATIFFNSNKKLSMPQINSSTKVPVVDYNSLEDEKNWYAAFMYIDLLALHPTPPSGKNLLSLQGNPEYMAWKNCAATQSKYIEVLSRRLARITRPNINTSTTDAGANAALTANMLSCAGLKKAGNIEPSSVENCSKYLSQDELERLVLTVCASDESTNALSETGLNHGDIIGQGTTCYAARLAWQNAYRTESAEFTAAVTGLQNLKGCWPTTSDPNQRHKASAPKGIDKRGVDDVNFKKPTVKKNPQSNVSANVRIENGLPVGVPVSADEIRLPETVAQ